MLAVRRKCDVRLLHLMLKPSDALTKLSDCQAAAPDRETARCTLAVVCGESPLQLADCNVIRDVAEVLHPMLRPSDALAILSVARTAAPDAEVIECTGDLSNFPEG